MEKLKTCAAQLGINLKPEQLEKFNMFYLELIDWNNRFNLTSITGFEEVQVKHFCDSLSVLPALNLTSGTKLRVIDIGTGAGFPGIPVKIALPDIELTLLEATAKKAVFLKHVTEKLGLSGIKIVTARAEEAAQDKHYRGRFDVVLCRAVAALPALVELCLPFSAVGGIFIAQKKGDIAAEIQQAGKAIRVMGGVLREVRKVELPGLTDQRLLIVIEKLAATPAAYPRRPGIPAKNPIM